MISEIYQWTKTTVNIPKKMGLTDLTLGKLSIHASITTSITLQMYTNPLYTQTIYVKSWMSCPIYKKTCMYYSEGIIIFRVTENSLKSHKSRFEVKSRKYFLHNHTDTRKKGPVIDLNNERYTEFKWALIGRGFPPKCSIVAVMQQKTAESF